MRLYKTSSFTSAKYVDKLTRKIFINYWVLFSSKLSFYLKNKKSWVIERIYVTFILSQSKFVKPHCPASWHRWLVEPTQRTRGCLRLRVHARDPEHEHVGDGDEIKVVKSLSTLRRLQWTSVWLFDYFMNQIPADLSELLMTHLNGLSKSHH